MWETIYVSHVYTQKSPIYTQKSPIYTQKSLIYTQKSYSVLNESRVPHSCEKQVMCLTFILKRALYTLKRALFILKRCDNESGVSHVYSKQPYSNTKQPHLYSKKPHSYPKEPYSYSIKALFILLGAIWCKTSLMSLFHVAIEPIHMFICEMNESADT